MEVTIKTKGFGKKEYHGVDEIKDDGKFIHIYGEYHDVMYYRTFRKDNIVYIDVLFFA